MPGWVHAWGAHGCSLLLRQPETQGSHRAWLQRACTERALSVQSMQQHKGSALQACIMHGHMQQACRQHAGAMMHPTRRAHALHMQPARSTYAVSAPAPCDAGDPQAGQALGHPSVSLPRRAPLGVPRGLWVPALPPCHYRGDLHGSVRNLGGIRMLRSHPHGPAATAPHGTVPVPCPSPAYGSQNPETPPRPPHLCSLGTPQQQRW